MRRGFNIFAPQLVSCSLNGPDALRANKGLCLLASLFINYQGYKNFQIRVSEFGKGDCPPELMRVEPARRLSAYKQNQEILQGQI
jgi:hypothetical protein